MASRERASSGFGYLSYLSSSSHGGNKKNFKDYHYQPGFESSATGNGGSASPSYTYEPSSYSNSHNITGGNSNSIYPNNHIHTQSNNNTYNARNKAGGGSNYKNGSSNPSSMQYKQSNTNPDGVNKGNIYLNNNRRSDNNNTLSNNINHAFAASKGNRESGASPLPGSNGTGLTSNTNGASLSSYYYEGTTTRNESNSNTNNSNTVNNYGNSSHTTNNNTNNKSNSSINSNSRYMSSYGKNHNHEGQFSASSSFSSSFPYLQQGSTGATEGRIERSADTRGSMSGAGFYSNVSNDETRAGNVGAVNGNLRNNSQIPRSTSTNGKNANNVVNIINPANNISVYPSSYNIGVEGVSNLGSGVGLARSTRPRSEYGYHKGGYFTGYANQQNTSSYLHSNAFSIGKEERDHSNKDSRLNRRNSHRGDMSRDRLLHRDDSLSSFSAAVGSASRFATKTRERMRPSSSIPAASAIKNRSNSLVGERGDIRGAYTFSTDQLGGAGVGGVGVSVASLHNFHNNLLKQENIQRGFAKNTGYDLGGTTTNIAQAACNLYRNHPSYSQSQLDSHQGPNSSGQETGTRHRSRSAMGSRLNNSNINVQYTTNEVNEIYSPTKKGSTTGKKYIRPKTPVQSTAPQQVGAETGNGTKGKDMNQNEKLKQQKMKKKSAAVGTVIVDHPNTPFYATPNSVDINTISNGDLPSDDRSKGSLESFVSDDNTIVTIMKDNKNDNTTDNRSNVATTTKQIANDAMTAEEVVVPTKSSLTESKQKNNEKEDKKRHRRNRSSSSSVSSTASQHSTSSSFSHDSELSANITIASVNGTNQNRERNMEKEKGGKSKETKKDNKTARKFKINPTNLQQQQQQFQHQQQQQCLPSQYIRSNAVEGGNMINKGQMNGNAIEKGIMYEGDQSVCHTYQNNFPRIPNVDEDPYSNVQRIGVSSVKGRRMYMEDEYRGVCNTELLFPPNSNTSLDSSYNSNSDNIHGKAFDQNPPVNIKTSFWAVFDGHAGGRCSKALASSVVAHCARDPEYYTNLSNAVIRGFHQANQEFLKKADKYLMNDGSTGTAALYRNGLLVVGNVGDSRCVLCSSGKAIPLSIDQKPNRPEEKKRIVSFGGKVVNCFGVHRVNGVLAVARAFGNRALRQVIRADAEVQQHILHEGDDFLILASDGLWDTMSNQECCDIVCRYANRMSLSAIAEILTTTSIRKGSMDNVTALVVDLRGLSVEAIERQQSEQMYSECAQQESRRKKSSNVENHMNVEGSHQNVGLGSNNMLNDIKKHAVTARSPTIGKEIEEEGFKQYLPLVHHREQLEQQEYHLNMLRENQESQITRPLTVMHSSVYEDNPSDLA